MDSKYSLRSKWKFLSSEVNSSSLLDNHGLLRVVSLQDVHLEGASQANELNDMVYIVQFWEQLMEGFFL
jgi:hypothetical protein